MSKNLRIVRCFDLKRYISLALALLFVLFLFTGCGKEEPENNGQAPTMNVDGLAVHQVVAGTINPFTGEQVAQDNSSIRPVCVMINNHADARPCKGLSKACIVYEALVEGCITRMMALFDDISTVDVGYIRSARPYFISAAQSYDAIYVHCGGSNQARSDIRQYGISDIDATYGHAGNAWVRDPNRVGVVSYEHTLYAKGAEIAKYAAKTFRTQHESSFDTSYNLIFSPEAVNQCNKTSTDFTVYYYGTKGGSNTSTEFKYDSARGVYNPYIKGVEYTDGSSTHIDFTNVIILNIATRTVDGKGHQEMNLVGSGTGYFCTGGKYVEIKWSRPTRSDSFTYALTDGTPLALGVGKTFVSIAPLDSTSGVIW